MNHIHNEKDWRVLCWNIRGLNAKKKWNTVRSKILETQCDIICLQETKKEHIDANFIKLFCPKRMDAFEFLPSMGASGGTLIAWSSSTFSGDLIFQNQYAQSVEFKCHASSECWILTNVYAPCTNEGRAQFLEWLASVDMPDTIDWLVFGDFNLIRSPQNRNKTGGDVNNMLAFN